MKKQLGQLTLDKAIFLAPNKKLKNALIYYRDSIMPDYISEAKQHGFNWEAPTFSFSDNKKHIIASDDSMIFDGYSNMWQPDVMWDTVGQITFEECGM